MKRVLSGFCLSFSLLVVLAAAPVAPRASATDTDASALFGRWLVVRSNTGRGLAVGSGLRFRADGYDVADTRRGDAQSGTCTAAGASLTCDVSGAQLTAQRAADGTVNAQFGPMQLVLAAATSEQAAALDASLAATLAQRAACTAASRCCNDAQNAHGIACDTAATLGARTRESCEAGLAAVRERVRAANKPLPDSCR